MAESPVPAALQAAYRATTYRVWLPEGAVDLREGEVKNLLPQNPKRS